MTAPTTAPGKPAAHGDPGYPYDAFLSYSHRDLASAAGVQRGLHQVGRRIGQLRALRIFRDETNLEVSPDLWGTITEALDRSRYLIVVLSPWTAQSHWVNQEISYWLEHRGRENLLLALADGQLHWDRDTARFEPAGSDAAPPALTTAGALPAEPFFIDISTEAPWDPRSSSFRDKITALAAPIHDLPKDQLAGEDLREQRRFRRLRRAAIAALSILTILAITAGTLAYRQTQTADRHRRQATALALTAQADTMLAQRQSGGDVRAMQQLAAASAMEPEIAAPSVLHALAARSTTAKVITTGSPANGVAVSPDGRRIASAGDDHTIALWDSVTGQQVGIPLTGHTSWVASVAFSPDGHRLVSGGDDDTVRLWNADTGREIGPPLNGHTDTVTGVAFSPDGRLAASGGRDDTVRLWDVDTGRQTAVLTGHTDWVTSVAFSPDGHRVASGSSDKTVLLWDADTHQRTGRPLAGNAKQVNSVAFSPDGRRVVSAGADATVRFWDAATGDPVGPLIRGHTEAVLGVSFSPDGQRVASAGADATLGLWDTVTGKPLTSPLTGHTDEIRAVAFNPDGRTLVTASADGTVRVWRDDQLLTVPGANPAIQKIAASPAANRMASVTADHTVRLWDVDAGPPNGEPLPGLTDAFSVAFSPDGKLLATGAGDHHVRLWNADTRALIWTSPTGQSGGVTTVAFSPDARRLASGGNDGTIVLWNAATGDQLRPEIHAAERTVTAIAFSPDGHHLASTGADGAIHLWDGDTLQGLQTRFDQQPDAVNSLAFSPNGHTLASGGVDKFVKLWDADSGKLKTAFSAHANSVMSVTFSRDGHLLASAGADGEVRLWTPDNGRVYDAFTGHFGVVRTVAFTPDGHQLISGGQDGVIRLWPTLADPAKLCDKLSANPSTVQWRDWVSKTQAYRPLCSGLPALADDGRPAERTPAIQLPFSDLRHPQAITVDRNDNLYVADTKNKRILELAHDAKVPVRLDFPGLDGPIGVTTANGDVFAADIAGRVYRLASGQKTATALSLPSFPEIDDIAADDVGNLYIGVVDHVVKLEIASGQTTSIPLGAEVAIGGLTTNADGDILVSDGHGRQVLRVSGGDAPVAVVTGTADPAGLTVDRATNALLVAEADNDQVLQVSYGQDAISALAFGHLHGPYAVAADSTGDVYVTDTEHDRVLKLPAAQRP